MEPFGDRRADLLAGIIASTVFNMLRGKDVEPRSPKKFMIDWDQLQKSSGYHTVEEQKRILTMIRDAQNAVVAARGGGSFQ